MFELQDFVKDDINLIEIYLFNFHDENVVGVNVEDEVIEKIKKKYFLKIWNWLKLLKEKKLKMWMEIKFIILLWKLNKYFFLFLMSLACGRRTKTVLG